jgi:hypothetical protein
LLDFNISFGTKRVHKFWYWIAKNIPDILTGCRPVTFKGHLEKAGFVILEDYQISQNTFPSEVIKSFKRNDSVPRIVENS